MRMKVDTIVPFMLILLAKICSHLPPLFVIFIHLWLWREQNIALNQSNNSLLKKLCYTWFFFQCFAICCALVGELESYIITDKVFLNICLKHGRMFFFFLYVKHLRSSSVMHAKRRQRISPVLCTVSLQKSQSCENTGDLRCHILFGVKFYFESNVIW